MQVKAVKDIGRQWVREEASKVAGFYGAYFIGSINWMAEEDPFPTTSDVDIKVVFPIGQYQRSTGFCLNWRVSRADRARRPQGGDVVDGGGTHLVPEDAVQRRA